MRSKLLPLLALLVIVAVLACASEAPNEAAEPEVTASEPPPHAADPAPGRAAPATRSRQADGAAMIWIEDGEFLMGSDASPYPAERPEHLVRLAGYWIDQLETSNAKYRLCVEAGVCGENAALTDGYLNGDQQPALASWDDAVAYCSWVGARLPSEAEWEKAARGADGRLWPWGHEFDETRANLNGDADGFKHTAPVGSFPTGASPYGLLDMAGNASEWVADGFDAGYYESSPATDPRGPAAAKQRVHRSTIANGGGGREKTRTVARFGAAPAWEYGFRCAVTSLDEEEQEASRSG